MRSLALLLSLLLAAPAHAARGASRARTGSIVSPVLAPLAAPLAAPVSALSLTPSAILALRSPHAQTVAPAQLPQLQARQALQPLSPVESSVAALEAFHETFQAEGRDAASPEAMAALSAIYEGPSPSAKARGRAVNVSPTAPEISRITDGVAKRMKARLDAFGKKVRAVRVGRFGLSAFYTKPDEKGRVKVRLVERKLEKGKVAPEELEAARPALDAAKEELTREWEAGQDEYLADLAAARKDVSKAVRGLVKSRLAIGRDLQKWGVPNVTPVGKEGWLKYVKLYRLGGQPTELGVALHEVLAPLVAKDPKLLSRVTQQSFDTAILELTRGLRYRDDPSSDDAQKEMRLGNLRDEGHDYPQWRKAHAKRARKALAARQPKDRPLANLGLRAKEQMPTPVLKRALDIAFAVALQSVEEKAPVKRTKQAFEALKALHAALALPFGPGGDFETVKHKQLLYILPILDAMGVHEDVIAAVIRSYPLGESLWRLKVHELWRRGITGKGVKVAIIDDGATFHHPDFEGVKKKHKNLTRDRGDDALGPHGTAMTGIVHAIAPEAELHVYQALSNSDLPGVMLGGDETDAALMKALDLAEKSGAKIISMSLGAAYGLAHDKYAKRLAELKDKGILVIVSAGNSGDELPPGMQVGSPGSSPSALTIGAVDYHGRKADFSSKGPVYNPERPMDLRDKPDLYAFGVNNKTAMALPKALYEHEPVPYRHVSGTSPATPHVSGVAALMLEAAKLAGLPLDHTMAGVAKSALLAAADDVVYRDDLPSIPVLLDAVAAVQHFLVRLERRQR